MEKEGMLGLSVKYGYVYYNWNKVHFLGYAVLRRVLNGTEDNLWMQIKFINF